MEIIDNINRLLGDELKSSITRGAKVRIAASTFSIYAFETLKQELEGRRVVGVHLTAPTFVADQATDKYGIDGVDLLLSAYGPTLSVVSKHWPVHSSEADDEGRASPEAPTRPTLSKRTVERHTPQQTG